MSRVLVLSGPSAVGKSTVVRCLRDHVPDLHFSVSATTRAPRPGEVDGVDYSFVTAEKFQQLIDDGELLEWAEIHGGLHRSGTPAEPVRTASRAGFPVLIEVDLAGARSVKAAMPEAISVFLAPPSWDALEARLVGRGTESPEVMARRLDTARAELAGSRHLRQGGRQQPIGVGVRGIGILAGGPLIVRPPSGRQSDPTAC